MFNRAQTCLFIQWTRPLCRFLLIERAAPIPRVLAVGSFDAAPGRTLAEQLKEHLTSRQLRCRQTVLLLPRAELEVSSHQLPPATDDELPELVSSAAAAEFEEAAGAPISDFLVTHQDETGCEALVFSLGEHRINDFKSSFKAAGLQLLGITFIGLGAVDLLQQVTRHVTSTALVISIGDYDTDLAVVEDGCPILFRSIPRSMEEDRTQAERLAADIGRTLAPAPRADADADADSMRLYLLGDRNEHEQLAQLLSDQLSVAASVINPLQHIESAVEMESPSRYANLLGVACAWNNAHLGLDLLHPRRPPRPPSPWRRLAFWGGIAAAVCLTIGYAAWQDRADQMAATTQQRETLKSLAKRANQARELQDVADAVQAWRSDDIAWLDELRELSERLPGGERALIRRMSMSTDAQGNGTIDLAVQVSQPEVVAHLEDAIRDDRHSVSSKRVTESETNAKFPWTFETRIGFRPAELPELRLPEEEPLKSPGGEPSADEPMKRHLSTPGASDVALPVAPTGGPRNE